MLKPEKLEEFSRLYVTVGPKKCQEILGLNLDTFKRYVRDAKKGDYLDEKSIEIAKITENFDLETLKKLSSTKKIARTENQTKLSFEGDTLKFLYITDTHFGSKYTDPSILEDLFEYAEKNGCQMVLHSGDVTDGLSNRKDHVYELTHIGYDEQRDHAVEVFSKCKLPIYMIAGNHDLYYKLSSGANIVSDICDRLKHCHYLGSHEGNIEFKGHKIRLWHGLDGNSYATSYRLQKIVESLYGGDKPAVLLAGHTHKMGYFFERNIHVVSGGSIQYQTKWMRGKRIAAHTGAWIIEIQVNERGIVSFNPTFKALYE